MSGASEDQAGVPSLFALWLSRKRQSLGLTLDDLAERMGGGCDPATIEAWEAGSLRPGRHMAERLARLFDVSASERLAFVLFAISDLDSGDSGSYPSPESARDSEIDPDAPWRVKANPPSNLPVQLTTFVGRESEIEGVAGLVRYPGVRLLTLLGPPGIGKTRFSLEVARTLLEGGYYEDGVFAIPLAAITDPVGIAPAIASALGVKEAAGGSPHQALTDFLRDKRLLLVLDNMEQIPDAGEVVTALLTAAPDVQIVTTSRSALRVYGEQVWRVPPLPVPEADKNLSAESLSRSEAATLFVQRARSVQPNLVVDDSVAPVIAEICRRLDGLPLAIELAAARTNVLSPQALLARLQGAEAAGEGHEGRLSTLTGGPQNLSPRQRTLRGAIEWSYNLLDDPERLAYRRLSVCVGGFGLDTAEAILNSHSAPHNSLDLISSLVDKSLLKQEEGPHKEARFAMLETIREYGLERLSESGEENEVRRAHAQAMLALAEQAEPHMTTGGRDPWLRKLDADLDNIRAALRWSLGTVGAAELGLRLAGTLHWFWFLMGHISEGRQWLEVTLQNSAQPTTPWLARARHAAAHFAVEHGDYAIAVQHITSSIKMWRELGNAKELAFALSTLGVTLEFQGHRSAGLSPLKESTAILRAHSDTWYLAFVLDRLADVISWQEDFSAIAKLYNESLELFRSLEDQRFVARELTWLGYSFLLADNYTQAFQYLEQALAIQGSFGDKRALAFVLNGLARCYLHTGELDRARTYFNTVITLFKELGMKAGLNGTYRYMVYLLLKAGDNTQATSLLTQYLRNIGNLDDTGGQTLALLAVACLGAKLGAVDVSTRLFAFIQASGIRLFHLDHSQYVDGLAAVKRANGKDQARWNRLWAEGSKMTLEHALEACQQIIQQTTQLHQFQQPQVSTSQHTKAQPGAAGLTGVPLSKRELELLRLLAVGLSNEQIASQLFLSPNTVRAHLYSIYSKINVSSRTAAARFAYEHSLT